LKAIEPDLCAGGRDVFEALKKKGYRLVLARKGVLSAEDLRIAELLGIRVYSKGKNVQDGFLELPYGKRVPDIYRIGPELNLNRVKVGKAVALINLYEFYNQPGKLAGFLRRNPRTRFLFTLSPSNPKEVKDPRDIIAYLIEVLGMPEERATLSLVSWPW